ncbi:UNVERIFIED_ORG: hypothetical protein GGI57_000739 [Rhizobium aethiopicum]
MPSKVPFRAPICGLKHDLRSAIPSAGGRYEEMMTAASLRAGEEIEDGYFRKTGKIRNYGLLIL